MSSLIIRLLSVILIMISCNYYQATGSPTDTVTLATPVVGFEPVSDEKSAKMVMMAVPQYRPRSIRPIKTKNDTTRTGKQQVFEEPDAEPISPGGSSGPGFRVSPAWKSWLQSVQGSFPQFPQIGDIFTNLFQSMFGNGSPVNGPSVSF